MRQQGDNQKLPPYSRRRFKWLAAGILSAIVLYSAGWFYAANALEEGTKEQLALLEQSGKRASCETPEAKGYPFRIGLFCKSVFYEDGIEGISASAGALRTAAQIYDPSQILSELDGPARLQLPFLPALNVEWESVRASARIGQPIPQHASLEGKSVIIKNDQNQQLASYDNGQMHMRQRENDIDFAFSLQGLSVENAPQLEPIEIIGDLTIAQGLLIIQDPLHSLRGHQGEIRTIKLSDNSDAALSLSGPFSIDNNGLLSASLKIKIKQPQQISALLSALIPNQSGLIESSFAGLQASENGDAPQEITVNIRDGKPYFGFFALGQIAPLP